MSVSSEQAGRSRIGCRIGGSIPRAHPPENQSRAPLQTSQLVRTTRNASLNVDLGSKADLFYTFSPSRLVVRAELRIYYAQKPGVKVRGHPYKIYDSSERLQARVCPVHLLNIVRSELATDRLWNGICFTSSTFNS